MGEPDQTVLAPVLRNGATSPILLIKRQKAVVGRVALDKFSATIGRADDCDIVLDDGRGVSRRHAQFFVLDGEVVIEDLDSRNGIYVNRKPCKRHTVRPGDRIAIGEYRLHVMYEQGDQLDRPENEGPIVDLMRLWAGAAVTDDTDQCPLCDTAVPEDPKPGTTTQPEDPGHEEAEEVIMLTPGPARDPATHRPGLPKSLRHHFRRRLIRRRRPLR